MGKVKEKIKQKQSKRKPGWPAGCSKKGKRQTT